jgi:small subunit ribosomal protein S8
MRHDLLSDVLSAIANGDRAGLRETITPASNMAKAVLRIAQRAGYIGEFEFIDDGRGGKFRISLLGQVNAAGSIRPRFAVAKDEYGKWEKRFLPASGFGLLIVSTPAGVMSHTDAKKKGIGGKLLAFIY